MKREAKIFMGPFQQKAWLCPICDELTAAGEHWWDRVFDLFAQRFWGGRGWSK